MALPSSGPISLSQVNVELELSATAQIGMNNAAVRTLFGKPSGAISMSDGYGKVNQFAFTISGPVTNANLRTLAVNAGWPGGAQVVATIAPGVVISANSTGVRAMTIDGAFPQGVALTNNGVIMGMGGNGGNGGNGFSGFEPFSGSPGLPGGPALLVQVPVTITNNNIIAGGGGGGAGSDGRTSPVFQPGGRRGGGGGGGGRSSLSNSSGGIGGDAPATVGPGAPGGAGTFPAAGAGGAPAPSPSGINYSGGPGGDRGASGGGAEGGHVGGGGGGSISGNPQITWISFGTRLGPIS
jgi:hypothetical protein